MFSKAPKRKGNLTGTNSGKKININQLAHARFASNKRAHGIYAHRLSLQTQPVIFVTIDYTLADVTLNSPASIKAEAARKMFSSYKA